MSKKGRLAEKQRKAAERDQKAAAKEHRQKNPSGGSDYAQKQRKKDHGLWQPPKRDW